MSDDLIPIDFVPGMHGHFLETLCNVVFGYCNPDNFFTPNGTSHQKSSQYYASRKFVANHWSDSLPEMLHRYRTVISISLSVDDLLLASTVSLLRAGDYNIDDNTLEIDTIKKLSIPAYRNTLSDIIAAYPVPADATDIPRYILREFFKFVFKDPTNYGLWIKQQELTYTKTQDVFRFNFNSFYDTCLLKEEISNLAKFLDIQIKNHNVIDHLHPQFLNHLPFRDIQSTCTTVINNVVNQVDSPIPPLRLLQESYVNAHLELLFKKEMPFNQPNYFTSTKDIIYYLDNQAPLI